MLLFIETLNSHGAAHKSFSGRRFQGLASRRHDFFIITRIVAAVGETFYEVLHQLRLVEGGGNVEVLFHITGFWASPFTHIPTALAVLIY